ncbi:MULTISPECIES: hypothetical protein [Alloalcanivorax]|uniref:Uncharacterized protein n=2 Tax=Alloalcanivorax TaxID=3020832 RepID=A0A9Q3ZEY8_9GAMM|nr:MULTISPECIES: hypothetical protein [Alloalcanivorax]MAO61081.1 hypothetical protein [Alcanivorax sp.]MBM1145058.1 hypothetical protein [Alcanivorax sp. ZXX171]MAY11556.1 hypothetical protein [Alcanivorax sp.]MBI54033.1 hypothetical protein [Alcanivorax sp.]MCE7511303.1 hypothetical protein [Alloalcanivorax xenomutans]
MQQKQTEQAGYLAVTYCGLALPLRVMHSGAGYYIGTGSDELGPVSRESEEYFPNRGAAEAALKASNWTQKQTP